MAAGPPRRCPVAQAKSDVLFSSCRRPARYASIALFLLLAQTTNSLQRTSASAAEGKAVIPKRCRLGRWLTRNPLDTCLHLGAANQAHCRVGDQGATRAILRAEDLPQPCSIRGRLCPAVAHAVSRASGAARSRACPAGRSRAFSFCPSLAKLPARNRSAIVERGF